MNRFLMGMWPLSPLLEVLFGDCEFSVEVDDVWFKFRWDQNRWEKLAVGWEDAP